jgi:hypothetical protein
VSVTPLKPNDELTLAADRLSRSAPRQWEEFIATVKVCLRERELACVQAPADKVLQAQGRALQLQELLVLLTSPPKQK